MTKLVQHGAVLKCSMGIGPSQLAVPPANATEGERQPLATVRDHLPMANIIPFALCRSPSNPQVMSATAAAMGVLTPQPCVPVTTAPWAPGAAGVTIAEIPALDDASTCLCQWAGVIEIDVPGVTAIDAG